MLLLLYCLTIHYLVVLIYVSIFQKKYFQSTSASKSMESTYVLPGHNGPVQSLVLLETDEVYIYIYSIVLYLSPHPRGGGVLLMVKFFMVHLSQFFLHSPMNGCLHFS